MAIKASHGGGDQKLGSGVSRGKRRSWWTRGTHRERIPWQRWTRLRRLWVEGGPKALSRAEVWLGQSRRTWAMECWVDGGGDRGESNPGMASIGRCVQGQVVGSPALGQNQWSRSERSSVQLQPGLRQRTFAVASGEGATDEGGWTVAIGAVAWQCG
jgi:hypothetical protein